MVFGLISECFQPVSDCFEPFLNRFGLFSKLFFVFFIVIVIIVVVVAVVFVFAIHVVESVVVAPSLLATTSLSRRLGVEPKSKGEFLLLQEHDMILKAAIKHDRTAGKVFQKESGNKQCRRESFPNRDFRNPSDPSTMPPESGKTGKMN